MRALLDSKRLWLPFLAAALCLLATRWTGAVLTMVALIVALGFVIDGATLLWSRSGGLSQHRQ
jgi:hypothetical protein